MAERKHNMPFGAELIEGGKARFRLWAPAAQAVNLLLTDGEPNIIPPRGHVQMLQRYFAQNKGEMRK